MLIINADVGASLARILDSLPEVVALTIAPVQHSIQVFVHASFLNELSVSTRLVGQLRCLNVNLDSLSDEHVCALSKLTGLRVLRVGCLSRRDEGDVRLAPLRMLTHLNVLSLTHDFDREDDFSWLADLTDLSLLYLESVPLGRVQLPSSLGALMVQIIGYEDLPQLMSIICASRPQGLECVIINCLVVTSHLDHDWLASAPARWPEHVELRINQAAADLDSFLVLCERAPFIGRGVQHLAVMEGLRHGHCSRLGAACPGLKSESAFMAALPLCLCPSSAPYSMPQSEHAPMHFARVSQAFLFPFPCRDQL